MGIIVPNSNYQPAGPKSVNTKHGFGSINPNGQDAREKKYNTSTTVSVPAAPKNQF